MPEQGNVQPNGEPVVATPVVETPVVETPTTVEGIPATETTVDPVTPEATPAQ